MERGGGNSFPGRRKPAQGMFGRSEKGGGNRGDAGSREYPTPKKVRPFVRAAYRFDGYRSGGK